MNWIFYWTLIAQVLIAIVLLTLPLSLAILMLTAAVRKDFPKSTRIQ